MQRLAAFLAVLSLLSGCVSQSPPAWMAAHDRLQQLIACTPESEFVVPGQRGAPAWAAAPLAAGLTIRTCRDQDNNTHYFVRIARPSPPTICRLRENEIFPASAGDKASLDMPFTPPGLQSLPGWSDQPPQAWQAVHYARQWHELGLVSAVACPPANDPRYMELENVTDGMLLQFQRVWVRVTASPDAFDNAFRDVPSFTDPMGKELAPPGKSLVPQLRRDIFERRARVIDLRCSLKNCVAHTEDYDLDIYFDLGPDGLVFTRLEPVFLI